MSTQPNTYQMTFYGIEAQPVTRRVTVKTPKEPAARPTMIRELPTSEQPVSRLEHFGPGALSVAELLAIVIGLDAVEDASALLTHSENLAGLARRPFCELINEPGIGPARAAKIKAAIELGYRLHCASPAEKPRIKSPADAAIMLMDEMGPLEQEHMVILILDSRNQVIKRYTAYVGSLNTAIIRVGELFREAIRMNAAAIVIAHNHPSGDPTPSAEDVYITKQVVEAGKLVNIDVLDHLVICQSRWVSLKERGLGF